MPASFPLPSSTLHSAFPFGVRHSYFHLFHPSTINSPGPTGSRRLPAALRFAGGHLFLFVSKMRIKSGERASGEHTCTAEHAVRRMCHPCSRSTLGAKRRGPRHESRTLSPLFTGLFWRVFRIGRFFTAPARMRLPPASVAGRASQSVLAGGKRPSPRLGSAAASHLGAPLSWPSRQI